MLVTFFGILKVRFLFHSVLMPYYTFILVKNSNMDVTESSSVHLVFIHQSNQAKIAHCLSNRYLQFPSIHTTPVCQNQSKYIRIESQCLFLRRSIN